MKIFYKRYTINPDNLTYCDCGEWKHFNYLSKDGWKIKYIERMRAGVLGIFEKEVENIAYCKDCEEYIMVEKKAKTIKCEKCGKRITVN